MSGKRTPNRHPNSDRGRPGGHPEIAKLGEGTRFGAENGPDPKEAGQRAQRMHGAPHSVRIALRRLAAAEFDLEGPLTPQKLARVFGNTRGTMTGAQMAACKKFQQAMSNPKAMDSLIEHIDGKLVQKTVEAKVTLAEIIAKSYDDAYLEGEEDELDEDRGD